MVSDVVIPAFTPSLRDSVELSHVQRPAPPNSATAQSVVNHFHNSSVNYRKKTKLKRSLTTQLMDADTIGLSEAYFTRDIHNYFPQSRKARVKTSNSEKRPRHHAYMSLVPVDNGRVVTSTSQKSIINSNRLLKNKSPPLSSYSIILTTATETKSLSLPQLRQTTSVSIKREHSFGTQNADDRHLIHSAGIHDTALDSNQYYGSYTIPRVNSWVQRWKTNLEMHTLSNLMRDDPKQGTKKRSTIGKYEYDFQSDSLLSSTASFSQYKTKRS